jgi:uncharacterized membrane protein
VARRNKTRTNRAPRPTGGLERVLPATVPTAVRIPLIDALRGFAIVLMIAYHFCFDLNYFGIIQQNFYRDPFWLTARGFILGSFLALVGVSLAMTAQHGIRWAAYAQRLALIALCATATSAGSYFLFPASWIYFGVLHFIFVAGLFSLAFVRLHWTNLSVGLALIAAGAALAYPLFDQPWLNWVGLMTRKPVTEDYVPLLPWFGFVLVGLFLGKQFLTADDRGGARRWLGTRPVSRSLECLGRHSLAVYMLHQPVLIGILYLAAEHRR